MKAFYNEIDKHCCAWLSNLMDAGMITPGVICDKSIEDIYPDELLGFDRVHMFAGIGIWDYALNQAGWGASKVWSGSCPCQPYSQAGKGAGFADERHLWPAFYHLIDEHQKWCRQQKRPLPAIFGEQVASKDVDVWIDLVHADLEAVGYSFGSVPFPSAGIGAPHIRDRNYWVANASGARSPQQRRGWDKPTRTVKGEAAIGTGIYPGRLANADGRHTGTERQQRSGEQRQQQEDDCTSGLANANRGQFDGVAIIRGVERDGQDAGRSQGSREPEPCGEVRRLADAHGIGSSGNEGSQPGILAGANGAIGSGSDAIRPGPTNGFWRDADWLGCTDGKWRPVEPGTFPLVTGLPAGMGKLSAGQRRLAELAGLDAASLKRAKGYRIASLRGYGNALNAEAARVWVECVMEAIPEIMGVS